VASLVVVITFGRYRDGHPLAEPVLRYWDVNLWAGKQEGLGESVEGFIIEKLRFGDLGHKVMHPEPPPSISEQQHCSQWRALGLCPVMVAEEADWQEPVGTLAGVRVQDQEPVQCLRVRRSSQPSKLLDRTIALNAVGHASHPIIGRVRELASIVQDAHDVGGEVAALVIQARSTLREPAGVHR
jgi:hypothetical protein